MKYRTINDLEVIIFQYYSCRLYNEAHIKSFIVFYYAFKHFSIIFQAFEVQL